LTDNDQSLLPTNFFSYSSWFWFKPLFLQGLIFYGKLHKVVSRLWTGESIMINMIIGGKDSMLLIKKNTSINGGCMLKGRTPVHENCGFQFQWKIITGNE